MSTREKELEDVLVEEETTNEHEIVLFNDDVNTFDHVITTLINVCEHTPEQAEQCSIIVHYKGKCTVKRSNSSATMTSQNFQRGQTTFIRKQRTRNPLGEVPATKDLQTKCSGGAKR